MKSMSRGGLGPGPGLGGSFYSEVPCLGGSCTVRSNVGEVQGLFVPVACIGSGDPVRVLHLYTINTLDIL